MVKKQKKLIISVHKYEVINKFFNPKRGVRYTTEAPPMRLSVKSTIVIEARIMLCSPFPVAPRNCEIIIAISKLEIAEKKRTKKLPAIIFNILFLH